jgi:hypothetical protein
MSIPSETPRQINVDEDISLARPGGMIVLGVYNGFARLPLRARRFVVRLSGYRFIPCDPVLRDRESEPTRRKAWVRDQYQHPEEHRHTLSEVQGWFAQNGVEYLHAYPSAMLCYDSEELFNLRRSCGGCTGQASCITRRWKNLKSSILTLAVVLLTRHRGRMTRF